jgi:hypothetical protein
MDDLLFDPRKVYTLREFWSTLGLSAKTAERERQRGNTPVTTQLSERRVGVLGADANAYVFSRRRVQSAREMMDAEDARQGRAA